MTVYEHGFFSPEDLGASIRRRRVEQGFSNVDAFIGAMKVRTGVYIDRGTMYKIERGEREPSVSKLLAICFTLYGLDWLRKLQEICKDSVYESFKNAAMSEFSVRYAEDAARVYEGESDGEPVTVTVTIGSSTATVIVNDTLPLP